MKNITRLTAMLVAIVLLLANISASATGFEEGIPIDELDLSSYETMLSEAEAVGLAESKPCGSSNPYCASVKKLMQMTTAQARYDYLASMNAVDYISVLMHYNEYHSAENILCLCNYPNFDAAYVPGGINHDAACPWHFANLPIEEQFDVVIRMNEDERASYLESVQDADKLALLNAYLDYAKKTDTEPCDPDTCPYNAKYTDIDFFSANTFAVYEYLYEMNTKANAGDYGARTEYLSLAAHLRDAHIAEGKFCQCMQFDMSNREHAFGTLNHSDSDFCGVSVECPWRFDRLTTAEQAKIYNGLSNDVKAKYYAELSEKQKADLDAFLNGVGKTEATVPSEDNAVTVDISVPAGVFGADVNHVMEADEAEMTAEHVRALNEVFVGHTLAAFDISFYNLNRPGEKLQPVNGTVPLTFTVDVSEVQGDSLKIYHLYEKNGRNIAELVGEPIEVDKSQSVQVISINASAFSIYVVADDCDGIDCGYIDYMAMSGFERHAAMEKHVNVMVEGQDYSEYYYITSHYNSHLAISDPYPYCVCDTYESDYVNMGYGSIKHVEKHGAMCPWHFSQISVEDQYTVIKDMTQEEREEYMEAAGLTDVQKETLNSYIATQEGTSDNMCVVVGNKLMFGDVALADITENGYIIDIATGIAVGRYDFTSENFIMGTGSN